MNNLKRMTARASAAAVATVLVMTFLPLAPVANAFAESETKYSFESGSFALHSKSDILLNEKQVTVNGSIYSAGEFDYTGGQEMFAINGNLLSGADDAVCEIPDYTKIIDCAAEYDFTFDGDKEVSGSEIDLSEGSFYAGGSVNIEHAALSGEGNITAGEDITMELYGDSGDSHQALIMSENGDISVNAANLSFSGVLYAPNGKVTINAKQIDITGAIYAGQIEINGTSLNVQYKNYIPDILVCKAADEDVIRVQQGNEITLAGFCNYEDAEITYSVADGQEQYVTIKNSDTLTPSIIFFEPGEYEITLTAVRGDEKASDTIKVIVSFGAVVHYTSSEDFESGKLEGLSGENNELKLSCGSSSEEPVIRNYSLNDESGVSVESRQNKSALVSAGDSLEVGYTLSGYGKTDSGNGSDVILVIDNSGSVSGMVPAIKETSLQILEFMGPNDRFGIASLDQTNTVLTDSKKALTEAINKYALSGGSNYGNGLRVAMEMFDEKSTDRNKYIILLADGENSSDDDIVAEETAKLAAQNGVKIYSFEINPFSNIFSDTRTMQQIAIETNGAYKLCPSADAISAFMLNMADSIYNLAARNVTFTTTVVNSGLLDDLSMGSAPDSVVYNEDGSATVSWNYNSFEIGKTDEIVLDLKADMLRSSGYELITTDTKLIYYNDSGEGSIIYLDDIIIGKNDYTGSGKWSSSVFDSKKDGCTWSLVKWNADYKGNSGIDVYLSTSSDGINFSNPVQVSNGQQINLCGRYIRTDIEMKVSEDGETPTLYDLTIYSDDDIKSEKPDEGNSIEICGAKTVSAGCPLLLWLDISGNYDNAADIEWRVTGGSNIICDEISQLKRNVTFAEEGEYNIKASVTAGGIKSEASVNITVLPEKKLSQSDGGAEFKPLDMTVSETPDYVTSYSEPVSFSISFKNPEQVSWMRVLYSNQKAWGETVYQAFVDEADENTVKITLPSTNPADTVITVQAFDWYGNVCEEVRTVRMDRTAPTVTLSADKSSMYPGSQAVITATATDNDEIAGTVLRCGEEELQIDENGQYIFRPTEPGQYVFTYTAVDKAGLETSRSITINVREDNIQPSVGISGTNKVILGNSADLKITASDAQTGIASWKLMLDDGTELISFNNADGEVPSEYIYTFTPAADGKYVFTAEAYDNAGNVRTAAYTVNCVADTKGPDITIELSKNEVLTGEQVIVSVSVSDDVSVSELHFFADGTEQKLSEDGTYTYIADDNGFDGEISKLVIFSVSAKDSSGNENTASKELRVSTVDETAPVIKISVPETFEYNSTDAYMEVTVTDNIGVDNIEVYIDDNKAVSDENGRYYFDTSELCEYSILVKASDTSGNEASEKAAVKVVDSTKPEISIVKDKSGYSMGDSAVFTVTVQDNLAIQSVEASCGGETIETNNGSFEYTIDNLEAGTYELYVKATDTSGNVTEKTASITVKDTEAPTVTVSADKEKYAAGEKLVIDCVLTDNVGVTKVEADLNGDDIEYDFEKGILVMPETYLPGEYVLSVTASDAAGNVSETASVSFEISDSSDTVNPVIGEVTYTPAILYTGIECNIMAEASDDSGNVTITMKIGDELLEYDALSGSWLYIPDTVGEVTLMVRAEDEAGNYAEKPVILKVYANPEGHKLKVDAPEVVSAADTITITLSSTDGVPFDEAELWISTQDLTEWLVQNSDGSFTVTLSPINQTAELIFNATGRDSSGYEDTAEFTIQVASDYQTEIQSEVMQASLAQTSETTLTDELKALAAAFDSPAEAYEYVYNNVAFECYVNSRRGAVGAYELKRGNDFDQASLLIGLLREMGYPARYASGTVILTEEQTMALMAMDDFESACGMISSAEKNASIITDESGQRFVKLDEIFVQTYVPYGELGETDEDKKNLGVWVNLDTSIKESELETILTDESRKNEINAAYSEMYNSFKGNGYDSFIDELVSSSEADNEIFSRETVKKEFSVLPSLMQYSLLAADNISVFNAIPDSMTDRVSFVVQGYDDPQSLGTYKISELYGRRVTIQYIGNTGSGTIFDMSSSALQSQNFVPALTVDGTVMKKADPDAGFGLDEYYGTWHIGKTNKLYTTLVTGGVSETVVDDLIVGSMYAFTFDTGGISTQDMQNALDTANSANPIDENDPNYPTSKTYYDEDKVGSFLSVAGKFYSAECYAANLVNAADRNVEFSTHTKLVITSYTLNAAETTLMGWNTGISSVDDGSFQIDVAYNSVYTFSRTGDIQARNDYMFSSSYMESFYEGWIWEVLTLHESVSTVSILDSALENGDNIVFLDKNNFSTAIESVNDLSDDELKEITSAVSSGKVVIVPENRLTINDWKGTGYIIADFENFNEFVFKVSGGINGGASTVIEDLDNAMDFDKAAKSFLQDVTVDLVEELDLNIDSLIGSYFSICNNLYYFALEASVTKVVSTATSCVEACSAGSIGALFAMSTGGKLINDVKGMCDVVNKRFEIYDLLYKYCMDEASAEDTLKGYVGIMYDLCKTAMGISLNDIRDCLLGPEWKEYFAERKLEKNVQAIFAGFASLFK